MHIYYFQKNSNEKKDGDRVFITREMFIPLNDERSKRIDFKFEKVKYPHALLEFEL